MRWSAGKKSDLQENISIREIAHPLVGENSGVRLEQDVAVSVAPYARNVHLRFVLVM